MSVRRPQLGPFLVLGPIAPWRAPGSVHLLWPMETAELAREEHVRPGDRLVVWEGNETPIRNRYRNLRLVLSTATAWPDSGRLKMMNFVAIYGRLTSHAYHPWYAIPLRLIVGFGFMQHGYAKIARGPENYASILHALGVPAPDLLAWVTILVELFGGLAVLLGAFIPLASIRWRLCCSWRSSRFMCRTGSAQSSCYRSMPRGRISVSPATRRLYSI